MGCREDSRGYVSQGWSKHEGAIRGGGRPLGVGKPLESIAGAGRKQVLTVVVRGAGVKPFLTVEDWSALFRVGRGMGTSGGKM